MNILILSHYAGSPDMGMVFRPYYFAKEWVKLGHSVTILSSSFTHIRKQNPGVLKDFQEDLIDGIKYVWVKTPAYKNSFSRVLNIFSFVFKVALNYKKIAKKYIPDIVISSCTYNLDIYSALKMSKYSKAKLVYEVRDLWPLTPIELGGLSKYNPFIMLLQYAENMAYKKSDFVVSVLPCVHKHMVAHGLDLKKLLIVPNGVSKIDWFPANIQPVENTSIARRIEKEKEKGNIVVGFTGAHGDANALEYLLQAFDGLIDKKLSLILVGDGKNKKNLQKSVVEKNIANVFFFDPVPKRQVPTLLSMFDILYIGLVNKSVFRFGISPNKLMDYMMSTKPILSAIKAGNDPVADVGCGISVEPANPKAIADGLMKLAKLSDFERLEMGKKGKDFILKNQTYDVLAKKFLDFVLP